MNTSRALLAATALTFVLAGCAANADKSPSEVSKPGADVTQHSQTFQPEPPCRPVLCPR